MPITIVLPTPPLLGPGMNIQWTSSFIGPLPTGSYFRATFGTDPEFQTYRYQAHVPTTGTFGGWGIGDFQSPVTAFVDDTHPIPTGTPAMVQVELFQQGQSTPVDSGSITTGVTWNNEAALDSYIRDLVDGLGQGGFTSTDRTDLQTTLQNTTTMDTNWQNYESVTLPSLQDALNNIVAGITATITGAAGAVAKTLGDLFSGKTFDLLTTYTLGTACAPDIIDVDVAGASFYGVQAECTSFPTWYVFTGPGDTYTQQSLGTLEIVRGGSVILRIGLHTTTHTVYPLPGVPLVTVETEEPVVPGDYHIRLWPGAETCWTLLGLELP